MTATQSEIKPDTRIANLADPSLYINRELSWLSFNERCLAEALDPEVPLLERVRFLAIFSNNLDEYYMVRVSGLKDQVTAGVVDTPPDGLTAQQQLAAIRDRVVPLLHEQRRVFHEDILPKLRETNVNIYELGEWTTAQRTMLRRYFEVEVFPVLT